MSHRAVLIASLLLLVTALPLHAGGERYPDGIRPPLDRVLAEAAPDALIPASVILKQRVSREEILMARAGRSRDEARRAVLKLLKGRAMYGYELVEALSTKSEGVLSMGQSTLYPLLYNLQAQGLIRPRWQKADSGRKRKYYSLTSEGERMVTRKTVEMLEFMQTLAQFIRAGST